MAQTDTQIAAGRAAAAFHLELRLQTLPDAPLRSGALHLSAIVSACYRSPAPLPAGTPVLLRLMVAVNADPPAPGARHLLWSALHSGQWLEVLANGELPLLRAVDDGVFTLAGQQQRPVFKVDLPPPEAAASAWHRLRRWLGGG